MSRSRVAGAPLGRRWAVFLRAVAHVPMLPFREALAALGCARVESYGMSGNVIFDADSDDPEALEAAIADQFATAAFLRSRAALARVVASDPYRGLPGAATMLLSRPVAPRARDELRAMAFAGHRPVARGRTIHFVHPARLPGRRAPLDLERLVGGVGTARSSRVVAAVLARM